MHRVNSWFNSLVTGLGPVTLLTALVGITAREAFACAAFGRAAAGISGLAATARDLPAGRLHV